MSWTTPLIAFTTASLVAISVPADAQHGRRVVRPVVVTPYFGHYYYDPFFWGFHGWGYPFYPPAPYGFHVVVESSARIQVTPRETEVYVDGYRAGIVDDFDGFTQRLKVSPGEHVIQLYLDGHKPIAQTIMFAPGETYRIRHAMEQLAAGDSAPPRPAPRTPPAAPQGPPVAHDALGRPIGRAPVPTASPIGGGIIAIRVQPGDAVILVDGERWQSSGDRLEIQVSPGPHRIDVQKNGYQSFTSSVEVRAGETATVNISLTKSEDL